MRLGSNVVKMDLYQELGVPADASAALIQRAYRQQVRLSHPDLNPGDPKAVQRMARLNCAAQVLLDPKLRQAYDQLRSKLVRGKQVRSQQQCSGSPATERSRPGTQRRAWFERRDQGSAAEWASVAPAPIRVRERDCEQFLRELRGTQRDRLVQLGERIQHWALPHQRMLTYALLGAAVSMIVSLRPVTLGIGPEHARQPLTISAESLTP